ncbi:hemerythrin domain-containing protein [Streptomyces sp. AK02-01A]|uniref:hemerythrin domain-containing protein n=1 Tax=Streptomyces sp. AK02-01A TaxID=3028648 RepID=UPI0029B290DA|nr:hemerythrin domain-containing protein [Streptomyces sp. AK02-01A]MDX3854069.1 hemerythrin domain-containing protein [Streptomyces sp. AK02-01A]
MYEEMIGAHTVMRRGAALVCTSYQRLVGGEPVDVKALVGTTRWLIGFVHRYHSSEDVLFWPVLIDLFPAAVRELNQINIEHQALEAELHALARAVDAIAAPESSVERTRALEIVGQATVSGLPAAQRVQEILVRHFADEEPVLLELFPKVPDRDIVRLRKTIVRGASRSGLHLVFGLMEDPDRVPGYELLMRNLPRSTRWMRPVLLARYRSVKKALADYS